MRFCPTCGTERVARFCSRCGFDFESLPSEEIEPAEMADAIRPELELAHESGESSFDSTVESELNVVTEVPEEPRDPAIEASPEAVKDAEGANADGVAVSQPEHSEISNPESELIDVNESGAPVEESTSVTQAAPQEEHQDHTEGEAQLTPSMSSGGVEPNATKKSGWYSDPINPNRLRFWDGDAWTDRVADKQSLGNPEAQLEEQLKTIDDLPSPVILEGLTYGRKYRAGASCFNCGLTPEVRTNFCEICGADLKESI
jgi:hypothetical protein